MARARPFHYYLIALMSFQPLLLLALVGVFPKAFDWRKGTLVAIALVPACFLLFISWISARELGFMNRHLAICIPSLYCCLFLWLQPPALWAGGKRLFLQGCLAVGIVQGILFQTVACHGDIPAFLYEAFIHAPGG